MPAPSHNMKDKRSLRCNLVTLPSALSMGAILLAPLMDGVPYACDATIQTLLLMELNPKPINKRLVNVELLGVCMHPIQLLQHGTGLGNTVVARV